MESAKLQAHMLSAFTVLIWGSTFLSSKMLLLYLSPLQLMLMRFCIAYLMMWVIKPQWRRSSLRDELVFLSLGLFGGTVYFWLENTALTYTLASNVSIIIAAVPILTSLLAHFFTKDEKLHKNVIFGFFIAILGVILVVFNGAVILKLNPLGDLLTLGAALCWAVYSVLLKRSLLQFDNIYLTRKILFYSILTALPLVLVSNDPFPSVSMLCTPTILGNLLFLGVLGSGVCYLTWNAATKTLGIVTTNLYLYLNPFITLIGAAIFLHERITAMGVIGALVILVGVFVSNRRTRA